MPLSAGTHSTPSQFPFSRVHVAARLLRTVIVATKRTVLEPHPGDRRYVRRDAKGRLTEDQVAVGKSLAADRRTKTKDGRAKGTGRPGRPEEVPTTFLATSAP